MCVVVVSVSKRQGGEEGRRKIKGTKKIDVESYVPSSLNES
jgi:hypothetical protein